MPPDEPRQDLLELHSSVEEFLASAAGHSSRLVLFLGDKVEVRLPPDAAPLGALLQQEFGSEVPLRVIVGFKNFPSAELPEQENTSHQPREILLSLPGISTSFEPPEITMHRGNEAGFGRVSIHNVGSGKLAGWLPGGGGSLRHPGTTLIVGTYSGPRTGVRKRFTLSPGESISVGFVTGTASVEPGPHYMVPPGRYELVVPLMVTLSGEEEQIFYAEGGSAVVL